MSKESFIIGIDEVGRGPLAGPVVVGALLIPKKLRFRSKKLPKLRDSKRLSEKQREIWFEYLQNHPKVTFALGRIYSKTIDKINIARAANLAVRYALRQLDQKTKLKPSKTRIYLDGGLSLKNSQKMFEKTLIRGDEKINAIKLASIVAKVSRDQYMKKLSQKYPTYGFKRHKGYGTKNHILMVKKYGPSPVHRLSFLRGILFN